ncbi:MAG: L-fucose/L-arabinose isomerase family protein [Roseiarcus sp.]|jgi:L-fucose isomerase-like protein
MVKQKMTMGVIVGNRNFFPDILAKTGHDEIVHVLERKGFDCIVLTPEQTKHGAVETHEDAKRCAELFQANRGRIAGVVVTLPNFGDERAIADTLRLARLDVPVLIQATPDDASKMTIQYRRDSFCGKLSTCNNLRQYGIPYSLTRLHTVSLQSEEFEEDLGWFASVCRVANGLHNLRVGCVGARPAAFNTVRYSEKILEAHGISTEPVDLSDILGRIAKLRDDSEGVQLKLVAIGKYVATKGVPNTSLMKMAKLAVVLDEWMKATDVTISALQCWTTMEEYLGVVPCTVMSMMSDNLMASACEADVCGAISMHGLALASQTPSALLDWNNNYGNDPNKAVCFHCSNLPKNFFDDAHMGYGDIISGAVGAKNAYGTVVGRVKAGPMSFARFSTDDISGKMRGYVGVGTFTDDPLKTFGGAAVVEIPNLQRLLHYVCENGFEHHVAANLSHAASAVYEATTRYLGWDMYWHRAA